MRSEGTGSGEVLWWWKDGEKSPRGRKTGEKRKRKRKRRRIREKACSYNRGRRRWKFPALVFASKGEKSAREEAAGAWARD